MTNFRVLGPVQVRVGDQQVALGGRQLKLLAFLLLNANRAVSSDALIDAVWGAERDGAVKRLQMAVTRLRKALDRLGGPDGPALRTVSGGYLLSIAPGELDAHLFAELVSDGRRALEGSDPALASDLLSRALELWRGPPLAEVSYEEFARAEIRRLEELRLLAVEARANAELQLGHHAAMVAELEALLVEQPSHERIAALLMLALYRSGRQADALEVYQRTRKHLAEELGLEPGPELTTLQLAVLNRDAAVLEHADTTKRDERKPEDSPDIAAVGPSLSERNGKLAEAGQLPPIAAVGRVPGVATSFVGRARELAVATELLRRTRLLTLTGAGGSGKTRLAFRLAETCGPAYGGGAVLVGFADITNPDLIVPVICHALGIVEQPDQTPAQRLGEFLRNREVLLVLDNLEQLTPGVAVLGEILSACPSLSMLATSREPLRLAAEHLYEVPVLDPEDAIELFTARARAVSPNVIIEREAADAVCERLDRLPLAIELAAARSRALSTAEILSRLEHRLPVLAGGPRDAPHRQRTLQATIDWSYRLLAEEEQRLLVRLSVFAGGCTLRGAEAVCDAGLDPLLSLVDRSLVRAERGRYRMLQTLREYALDRLTRSGEEDDVRRRHAQWCVELLHAHGVDTFAHPDTMNQLEAERENFRGALEWAEQAGEVEIVAHLAVSLSWWWNVEGNLSEAGRWLNVVRQRSADYPLALQARVLAATRHLAWERGAYQEAVELSEQALAIHRELGDVKAIVLETSSLAASEVHLGNLSRGRTLLADAIQLAREHELKRWLPSSLANLADIEIAEGALDRAQTLCQEALTLATEVESSAGVAVRINLAHIANLEGRYVPAAEVAQEALNRGLASGHLDDAAAAAVMLAWSLAELRQPERAAILLGAALGFFQQTGTGMQWSNTAGEHAARNALSAQLDEATLSVLIDEGRTASLEQFGGVEHSPLPL